MDDHGSDVDQLRQSIVEIAVEAWRFRNVFERAMSRLEAGDGARYMSQYAWFSKKVIAALEAMGLRIVNVEGKEYDVGMAVMAVNLDDFDMGDRLFIEKMIEPIVMDAESVVKTGTVILGRVNE